jgi:hypothetical protein
MRDHTVRGLSGLRETLEKIAPQLKTGVELASGDKQYVTRFSAA